MIRDRIINEAIEREEYMAHLRQEKRDWEELIAGTALPRGRATDLITNDQKEGE